MWGTTPRSHAHSQAGRLPEGGGGEGAQGAWAILPFPGEEAPGLIHWAGPSLNPGVVSPRSSVLWTEQAPSLSLPFSSPPSLRDPAFLLSGKPEPEAPFPGGSAL